MNHLVILTSALVGFASCTLLGRAQIVFAPGSDSFELDYQQYTYVNGNDHDVLTSVAAITTGVTSSTSGTDLSSYATLTGGGEAVNYEDGTTGTTIPNYGDGSNPTNQTATATELFTFEGAAGGTLTSFTFDPSSDQTGYGDGLSSVSIAYSTNGGTTFTTVADPTATFTITPDSNSVEILETENLNDESYSAILNHGASGSGTLNGYNFDLSASAEVTVAPEPSAWALLLSGGVAVLGLQAFRRRNA